MFERIEVTTADGVVDGRLFAAGGEPRPLVVSFMDAGGLRPAMSTMARPLVDAGYAVLQPNLYWRHGDYAPFDTSTVFGDPDERERLMAMVRSVAPDQAMADTAALLDAVAGDPRVRAGRVACVGYCLGGRMAFIAATRLGDRVAAAASIHGGGLVTDEPDSPHRSAANIDAAIYLAVADEDPSCTPEHQSVLREALGAAGVRYQLEVFEGARHGFAVPDFPVYDERAAERQWQRVLELFGTN